MVGQGLDNRRPRHDAARTLLGEGRRFLYLAADEIADDQNDDAEQEGHAPTPGHECVRGERIREGEEHCGGEDLARLYALQGKAGEKASASEWRMLEDHGARAGYFPGNCEALYQPQRDEKDRREDADLLIGRQDANGHRRETHQKEADEKDVPPSIRVAQMAQHEGADRPCDIADAIGRKRRDNGDSWVVRRKKDLREDDRGRRRVDEEIIIFERGANPAAGCGRCCLAPAMGLIHHDGAHVSLPDCRFFLSIFNSLFWRPPAILSLLSRESRKIADRLGFVRRACRCRLASCSRALARPREKRSSLASSRLRRHRSKAKAWRRPQASDRPASFQAALH